MSLDELSEDIELANHLHIYKVENGYGVKYEVPRIPKEEYGSRTRSVVHVFPTLAGVMDFLGKHYEPSEAPNA